MATDGQRGTAAGRGGAGQKCDGARRPATDGGPGAVLSRKRSGPPR